MVMVPSAMPWAHPSLRVALDLLLIGSLALSLLAHRALQPPRRRRRFSPLRWWGAVLAAALLFALAPAQLWAGGTTLLVIVLLGWSTHRAARAAEGEPTDPSAALWPWFPPESGHSGWSRALQISWAVALALIVVRMLARCRS